MHHEKAFIVLYLFLRIVQIRLNLCFETYQYLFEAFGFIGHCTFAQ